MTPPSDKERRHLVASLACGILASRESPYMMTQESVVACAFQLYDELIRVDALRLEDNSGQQLLPAIEGKKPAAS